MNPLSSESASLVEISNQAIRLLRILREGILVLFIVELVLGGSLGFVVFGVPVRKVLVGALLLYAATVLLNLRQFPRWSLGLIAYVLAVVLGWAVFVPVLNGVSLAYSLAEATPILCLLVAIPIADSVREKTVRYFLDRINLFVAFVAALVIFVWTLANIFGMPEYALSIRLFFQVASGDDFGMYIGPMHDGSYRVMWITCMLFPFMLFYKNLFRINVLWSIFYISAIYATGTRSFLYGAIFVFGALLLRHQPRIAIGAGVVVVVAVLLWAPLLEGVRVFEVSSEFDSDSARSEQFFSLGRLFFEHPVFGAGLGAQADLLRSEVAPYSYELTYSALLAKLGIVGFVLTLVSVGVIIRAAIRWWPEFRVETVSLLICFVFITSTNPYLINVVGMTVLAFFIAICLGVKPSGAAARVPMSSC